MTWAVPGYHEIKELGRGASGRVVLAEAQNGTKVAIKYLAPHLARDPEFVSAFRTEARILSEVENPQIASLYEYIETPEGAAIVMELVDGVALRQIIKAHGPTEPQSALLVLKGSLLGLAAAHGLGIVHRDYKPENVLVNQEGQSKLADFGIAAREGRHGVHAGTPSYMAPEQWAGAPASASTDIYAATATFYECLTGHPPFRAPGDLLGLRKQHEEAPIPIDAVPEAVRGLVRRGLAKKVEHRPKDAATFLVELEQVAGAGYGPEWEEEGRGALARRAALLLLLFPIAAAAGGGTGVAKSVLGWSNKSLNTLLAGGVTLAVLAGGAAWFLTQDNSPPPPIPFAESSASAEPSPSPSAVPSESPSPSPSASPSASPSPSKSKSPSPSVSPKPLPRINNWLAPYPNTPNDFCWINSDGKCVGVPQGSFKAHVKISINTSTGATVALKLRFVQVYYSDSGAEIEDTGPNGKPPIPQDVTVPAGANPQTLPNVVSPDMRTFYGSCTYNFNAKIKLTITSTTPGVAFAPVYISDNICIIG